MRHTGLFYALVGFLMLSVDGLTESRVVTRAELRTEGVTLRRIRHDTPMASLALEAAVVRADALALYRQSECIVLDQEIDAGRLNELDGAIQTGAPVVRRAQSEKNRPVFLVLGKEVKRAYLVFTFSALTESSREPRRFLIPVSAVVPQETERAPQ